MDDQLCCIINLLGNDRLLLCTIYRSPNSTATGNLKLLNLLDQIYLNNSSHKLIVGDFNFKQIDWTSYTSNSGVQHPSSLFISKVKDCYLYQHVNQPTRFREGQQSNILDLIFTNEEGMIDNLTLNPGLGLSDHLLLSFNLLTYTETHNKTCDVRRYNFLKGNYNRINDNLHKLDLTPLEASSTIEETWNTFEDYLKKQIADNVPTYKLGNQSRRKPYISREAQDKIRKKSRLWTKYLHCKTTTNFDNYKKARNEATKALRLSKYSYEQDIASKIKTNPKLFWKYVRSKTKTAPTMFSVKSTDGIITQDPLEVANIMKNYFASVFTKDDPSKPTSPSTIKNIPVSLGKCPNNGTNS
ncbi:uncharacterized protein [Argopecten irradians]|uniref:uncharacterized protein n=1 Tax=Argopecten irradians TaxID=31199 RepID=UPI0037153029